MASVVYQGLQSCLEPRLVEPLVLSHQLATPNPSQEENSCTNENNEDVDFENDNKNGELGGWSFIQAFSNTNTPQNCKKESDEQKIYVHPLDKSNSSTLSLKSLEMCTESLGSESGSDISESSDELSYLSCERKKIKRREFAKKTTFSASFPPPLTSINGSHGVRVRPHREGGRLVIKAVNFSSTPTYFQADRTNGRLRLSLLKDCNSMYYDNIEIINNNEEEHVSDKVEEENENVDEVEGEEELEPYGDGDGDDDDDDDDDDHDHDHDDGWEEDMEGNSENVGYENGINEELARPSRCKENNGSANCKGMPIWGPYCVAIS